MNLFKNKVVPASVDASWMADQPQIAGFSPRPMLAVTRPHAAGSKEETTLTNMLKACGYMDENVAVLSLAEEEALPWSRIADAVTPGFVLLLGVPPAALGISAQLPANVPAEFGGVTFIWTASLQHLTETEAARKALWKDVLQPLFKAA